ncbi:MAG: bifunctional transaldolase/phosoglucose isomerase [Ignavibacteria bacterium]
MNKLLKLSEYGQSYWLDNLSRKKITGGELRKRITEGLRGITSNPATFSKALSEGNDYDEQIRLLVRQGRSLQEIYEELTVKDLQDACDILKPVYEETGGIDGFVSLEVSPYLAHDTEGTKNEARRLFKKVDRVNCYIKIPGTHAGVPAIEEMLYEGINVNITLLFSIQAYEAVAEAYIKALERRAAEGKPVNAVKSVASFFLSRIDVLADQLIGHKINLSGSQNSIRPELLFGKAAIASAKLAYQSYKRIFSGERWKRLSGKGAHVQRPLWASTGTKDPLYSETYYVEPLIGRDTVNTMPETTIAAFAAKGKPHENTIEDDLEESKKIFGELKTIGIDIDFITGQLLHDGIQKFIEPYDKAMTMLAAKRAAVLSIPETAQTFFPGGLKNSLNEAFKSLNKKQYTRRLFNKDPFLWKEDPENVKSIKNRLGWLDSIDLFLGKVNEIKSFAEEIKNEGFKHAVLLGMGGSSLCPEVAQKTFGPAEGYPELIVLDNTSPEAVADVDAKINLSTSLFIVPSKSGTTTETLSFYKYFYDKVKQSGAENPGKHFIAITDQGTPLEEESKNKNFRRTFINPADIGGRYSALSYFGLVPMALIGISTEKLLEYAHQFQDSCDPFIPAQANPAVSLGALLGIAYKEGKDKVTFIISESLSAFGDWVEQLIAESTGKEGKGLVPVVGEDAAKPEFYLNDRIFIYMYTKPDEDPILTKKVSALENAGHPVVKIELQEKISLGAEFFRWEIATAIAGAVIGVNPFNEPNVAESKKNTKDLLAEWKQKGSLDSGSPKIEIEKIKIFFEDSLPHDGKPPEEFLNNFLNLVSAGTKEKSAHPGYVSILAYFLNTPQRLKILNSIRKKIRVKLRTAATLGFGPRYLHSTGQLHKGGEDEGIFIILTSGTEMKVPIPDDEFDFNTLQTAQALGDYRSLANKNRKVIRIHLGNKIDQNLKRIEKLIGG